MTKMLFSFLASFFCLAASAQKFDDVTLPSSLTAGKDKIVYNGGGTREKYFIDIYVAGLYLAQKSGDASKIVKANEPMAIKIHIVSSLITGEKMKIAVDEGFEKSAKEGYTASSSAIAEFSSYFKEIKIGDEFDVIYVPAEGTQVYKNNKLSGTIKGFEFKKALFDIWLGSDPADSGLKKGLLGS